MSSLTVYTYANCDTCRRAVKWLRARKMVFTERAIRETPPGLDPSTHRHIRPYDDVIVGDTPWQQAFEKELVAKW